MNFCNETLLTVSQLIDSVDGLTGLRVRRCGEFIPVGTVQDCEVEGVKSEWVDQHGPGIAGDDFWGSVAWRLGDYYLIADFAT